MAMEDTEQVDGGISLNTPKAEARVSYRFGLGAASSGLSIS